MDEPSSDLKHSEPKSAAATLAHAVIRTRSITCVGLDPRRSLLPEPITDGIEDGDADGWAAAYETFCCEIIDAVADRVPCVKPQSAFFECLGPPGVAAMARVIRAARRRGLIVVVDAKRNDIGSTGTAYADAYLGERSPFGGDWLTVSPYLGRDSIDPFLDTAVERHAGVFALVKTSNPGGGLLQDRRDADGTAVYQAVADMITTLNADHVDSFGYGPVGGVVGATYPEQLAELRRRMPNAWILIPGFGAQGGGADDVVPGVAENGLGAIVNSSRHIIFAHRREEFTTRWAPGDWVEAVVAATDQMNAAIADACPTPTA